MLPRVVQRWFWDSYDSLWQLGLANLALFVPGFLLGYGLLVLAAAAGTATPAAVGIIAAACAFVLPLFGAAWFSSVIPFAAEVAQDRDPPLRRLFAGMRGAFLPLWKYLSICGAAAAVLGVNLWFYMMMKWWPIAGVALWALVLHAAAMLHGIPLAARLGTGPVRTLRVSWSLMFAHPVLTAGVLLMVLALWILGGMCRFVGIMLFGFSGTGTLLNALHDTTQEWQQALSRHVAAADPADPRAILKARALADADVLQPREDDTRYRRGARQILRPWE
jgi:hypothetical protein